LFLQTPIKAPVDVRTCTAEIVAVMLPFPCVRPNFFLQAVSPPRLVFGFVPSFQSAAGIWFEKSGSSLSKSSSLPF
jgi:hypothetical protein